MESKGKRSRNIPQISKQTINRKAATQGFAVKSSTSQLQQPALEVKEERLNASQQSRTRTVQKPLPKSKQKASPTVKLQTTDDRKSKPKAKIKTPRKSKRTTNQSVQVSPPTRFSPSGRPMRRVRRETLDSVDKPGIHKVTILPSTQKMLNCLVGKDVTAEDPCKHISKEDFEDVLNYQGEESEFLLIKNEILSFPCSNILVSYIPNESINYEEFYICVTEQAELELLALIRRIKEKREARINNSIFKSIKPWQSQGSEAEVEELSMEGSRPLLEVELNVRYPIIGHKRQFKLMLAQNEKLRYSEILLNRFNFSNTLRRQIDACVQVSPFTTSNGTQTKPTSFRNFYTESNFDPGIITKLTNEFKKNIESFIADKIPIVDDILGRNDYLNLYEDDYADLVVDEQYTHVPYLSKIKEDIIVTDQDVGKAKVISCASWHPAWDGVLATAHSNTALNSYYRKRNLKDQAFEVVPVLLWSILEDYLTPKLYLETPREITSLSFCPFNYQILLGGCCNGQVVLWDLQNKCNVGGEEQILPTQKHVRLQPLTEWMKIINNKICVRTTAVSHLLHSHKSAVTCIKWLSPFGKVSGLGKISNAPETKSLQFMTCSLDGSVLFWDLLVRPRRADFRARKKQSRLERRPSALTVNVSSFRSLNRIFRPIYKTRICAPGTSRALPLTVLDITNSLYQEVDFKSNPGPYYKPTRLDEGFIVNQFIAGTSEGDFFIATWDGHETDTGDIVNTETCRLANFSKFHDGPVVAVCKSPRFSDIILTVGGSIFALWKMDVLGIPILWRKSKRKYTHGAWDIVQLSTFHLVRDDGSIEIWNLKACYTQYEYIKHISGGNLLGIYQSDVRKSIIGITDPKGNFNSYTVCHSTAVLTEENKRSCYKICQREKERKLSWWKWQEGWKVKNKQLVEKKSEQETKEIEKNLYEEMPKVEPRKTSLSRPKTSSFSNRDRDQWRSMERKLLSASLLRNKRLNKEELLKQQLPNINIANEDQIKKRKQIGRLQKAQQIFKDTATMHFPSVFEKEEPPAPDLYSSGDFLNTRQEILKNYKKAIIFGEDIVRKQKYDPQMRWFEIVKKAEIKIETRNMMRSNYYINCNRNYGIISSDKMNQYNKALRKRGEYKKKTAPAEYADSNSGDVCSAILSALSLNDTELCDLILDLAL